VGFFKKSLPGYKRISYLLYLHDIILLELATKVRMAWPSALLDQN